ncbi:MAG: carboxy terminal-processing peptidase [Pirellulales bacterium]
MNRLTSRRYLSAVFVSVLSTAILGGGILGLAVAVARPTQPSKDDRQIAVAVVTWMEHRHLTGQRLDDTVSRRCLDTFIKDLDTLKLFFLQSDIDEFMASRDRLDDWIKAGNVQFAYTVFDRFLTRVDEQIAIAQKELLQTHDFSVEEDVISDPDDRKFPRTPEENVDRWRKQVKLDLLKEIADDVPMEEAVKKLRKRYESVRRGWQQTNDKELLERYLSAMTSSFDPHSSYMAPESRDNFDIVMKLELDGIGASLRNEDGYTVVQTIIPGGAADREGSLKPKDKVVGVGEGTTGGIDDVVDMKLNDVVKKIRGTRGTIVRLEVIPAGESDRKTYTITRDRIELKDSEARSEVIERGKKADGNPYRIGVINLPSFYMDMEGAQAGLPNYRSATRDVRRLLEHLKTENVDEVVVDLRLDGGGSLTEAVSLSGLFIDSGPVVQVKGPDGRIEVYRDEPGMVWGGPLVVMINRFSASASEIFAGAIQDYGRGIIIGDQTTHGKGTVQQLINLGDRLFLIGGNKDLGALKMTIQKFYRPGGDSTQNRGVASDVELPSIYSHLDLGESDLPFALAFDRVDALPHDQYQMVSADLINTLKARSQGRVTDSEYFKRELRRIDRLKEQKARKTVSLNKEKFLAERKELNAEKDLEKDYDNMNDPGRPIFEKNDYGFEALDIAVDYLELLGGNKVATAARTAIVPQ